MNQLLTDLKNMLIGAIVGVLLIALYGGFTYVNNTQFSANKPNPKSSVTVTRMDGRSGGSGVVLTSNKNSSLVLTNAHVCRVIENGGMVRSDFNIGVVVNYQVSNQHDLCLITTNVDMHVNTDLSANAPGLYDDAIVIGHPRLLPTIVQRGMFSHKKVITLLDGFRRCTDEDWKNDKLAPVCFFLGGIPNIIQREAQVISAFISPGSSGSPVFNKDGEVAGLVFAGSGDPSYGLIVPSEYVNNFMNVELPNLEKQIPKNGASDGEDEGEKRLKNACMNKTADYEIVKEFCDFVTDGIY